MTTTPQDALSYILKGILPDSEGLYEVTTTAEGNLNIHSKKEIIGQIIGKQGRIIKSIRLMLSVGFPHQLINIEVTEKE